MHCLTDDHTMKLTSLKKRKSSPAVPSNPSNHPPRPVSEKFGRISCVHANVMPKDVAAPNKNVLPNDENQTPNRTKPCFSPNSSEALDSSFSALPPTMILEETATSCDVQDASIVPPEETTSAVNANEPLLSPNRRDELPVSLLAPVDQSGSIEVTDRLSMLSAVSAFYDTDCVKASDQSNDDVNTEDDASIVTIATTSVADDSMMKGQSIFVGCLASDLLEEENMEEGDDVAFDDVPCAIIEKVPALNVETQSSFVDNETVDEIVHHVDHLVRDPISPSCSLETADHADIHASIEIDSVCHSLETPKCSNVDRDAMCEPMSFFVSQNKDKVHWSCKLCGIFNLQEHSVKCHCLGRKHRLALEKAVRNSCSPPKPDFVSRSPRKILEERLSFQMALDDAARSDPRFVHIVYNDASTTKSSWSCQLCNMTGLQMKDVEPHCLGKKHTTNFQKFSSLQCATVPIRKNQSKSPHHHCSGFLCHALSQPFLHRRCSWFCRYSDQAVC